MSCGGDEGATFYHTAMDREMGSSSSVGRRHKTDLCQQCEQLGSLHHVRLHEYRHHGNHDSTVVCILFSWELFCYFTRTANCSPRAFDAKTHQLAVRACAIPPPSAHARDQSRTTPIFFHHPLLTGVACCRRMLGAERRKETKPVRGNRIKSE